MVIVKEFVNKNYRILLTKQNMSNQPQKRKRGRPTKAEMAAEAKRFPFSTVSWYGNYFTIPVCPALLDWVKKHG